MTARDAILHTLGMSHMVLTTYLSDLSDADLMRRPAPGANHIAWQLGHLISAERGMGEGVCPGSYPPLPAGFDAQHAKETTHVDDPAQFLTKAQYLELFEQQRSATKVALSKLSDADLDKPGAEQLRQVCPTIGATLNLIGGHELMHAGQFATVRRLLGKPVLI